MSRRILCAMLIGCCVLGLSACGKSEAEQAADYYENELGMDREDAEDLANAVYGDKEETKDATESETIVEIKPTDEILAAEKFSNKVQICNTVYEFPVTVGELLESGELTIGGTDNEPDVNENSLVPEGGWKAFTIKGNGVDIQLSAINESTSMTELKNCLVENMISIGAYNICTNVFLGGGLRYGMPYSEFMELFGEPDEIGRDTGYYIYLDDMYYNRENKELMSANGCEYSISIDMDNACVSGVYYTVGEGRGTEYKECMLTTDDRSVQYYMPDDLLSESYYWRGRYVEVDGENYVILRQNIYFWQPWNYDGTAESLCYATDPNVIESMVNDDGSVFVVEYEEADTHDDEWCRYTGHYYLNDYCLVVPLTMYADESGEKISDAAKQELLNLVKEIFSKGVTIK